MQDNGPKTIGEVREEAAKVCLKAIPLAKILFAIYYNRCRMLELFLYYSLNAKKVSWVMSTRH